MQCVPVQIPVRRLIYLVTEFHTLGIKRYARMVLLVWVVAISRYARAGNVVKA